jgi:hypothetical protein
MIITIGFVCALGWVVGVWVPWYIAAGLNVMAMLSWLKSDGKGVSDIVSNMLLSVFCIIVSLSCFIFGDNTFAQIGKFLVMLFTGNTYE